MSVESSQKLCMLTEIRNQRCSIYLSRGEGGGRRNAGSDNRQSEHFGYLFSNRVRNSGGRAEFFKNKMASFLNSSNTFDHNDWRGAGPAPRHHVSDSRFTTTTGTLLQITTVTVQLQVNLNNLTVNWRTSESWLLLCGDSKVTVISSQQTTGGVLSCL